VPAIARGRIHHEPRANKSPYRLPACFTARLTTQDGFLHLNLEAARFDQAAMRTIAMGAVGNFCGQRWDDFGFRRLARWRQHRDQFPVVRVGAQRLSPILSRFSEFLSFRAALWGRSVVRAPRRRTAVRKNRALTN